ncbi:MAG TPA: hypothetical protein VFZ34_06540 [Blastocatellia bacterium]|nr:hypothetical protein [Blastocatellia bacterium]
MKIPNKLIQARGFINALLLALLLNLSGHVFLHLGDAVLETAETHWSGEQEPTKTTAPQHQCSVCQDHQQLALDTPATASFVLEAVPHSAHHQTEFPLVAPAFQRPSDRAPPRC